MPPETGAPQADRDFLAFGRWLKPASASEIERAVEKLRSQAQSFDLVVETTREEVEYVIAELTKIVERLRAMSPLFAASV